MKKPKNQFPFIMLLDEPDRPPLYRQIYEAIRGAILSGKISSNTRLPSTRQLASHLGISRITAVNAYDQLFAEGYLEGRSGSGTYVASQLPDLFLQAESKNDRARKSNAALEFDLSFYGERLMEKDQESIRNQTISKFRPFQNGITAIDEFPFEIWAGIASRIYRNPPRNILGYGDPQGLLSLRKAIAGYLRSSRAVNCSDDQIIITSGAQQAIDLTARIFLSEGDNVFIEDPGYREARNVFAAVGANPIPIAVDKEGISLSDIAASRIKAKLIYTTPSHQYPTGATMSLSRRLGLIEYAASRNCWIIEDDYNSEFRYAGRPLASMQGLEDEGRVIYVGTFSKTIFPSLRLGCMVLPQDLVGAFSAARAFSDVHSSIMEQAILAEFIAEGHFARHIRKMRKLYERRKNFLVEICDRELSGLLEIEKADAGMHLVGWLREGMDDKEISEIAAKEGFSLAPISDYCIARKMRGGFVLGYTGFDEREMKEAILKLKGILDFAT